MKKLISKKERVIKQVVVDKKYEYICDNCKKVYRTDVLNTCKYCRAEICKRCGVEDFDYDNDSYCIKLNVCKDCKSLHDDLSLELGSLQDEINKAEDAFFVKCKANRKKKNAKH